MIQRNRLIASTLVALSFACLTQPSHAEGARAARADWKLYGHVAAAPAIGSDAEYVFYLQGSVRRLASGHLEVWTKGLSDKRLTEAHDKIDTNDALMRRLAEKLVNHYVPPIASITPSSTSDEAFSLTVYEEIADEGDIEAQMKVLYEIDCAAWQMRELSIYMAVGDKHGSTDVARSWTHIAPESNGSNLATLLCKSA